MTMHLFGTVITAQAVAHNNRGESEGTVSTLQKVIRDGDIYSTVSGEAIRYALREGWQSDPKLKPSLNRQVGQASASADGSDSKWEDKKFEQPGRFVDDDVLGYMNANTQVNRRGILEIGRAVSITHWPGTVSAHFASPGSNVAVGVNSKTKQYEPIPYACEVHDTRYQYTFALTPDALLKDKYVRTEKTLHALQNLRRVGGGHARFLFDFAPEAIVLRWTADPAPRVMFVFDQDDRGRLSLKKLLARTRGELPDVSPNELYIGTAIDDIPEIEPLKAAGAHVSGGVRAAVAAVLAEVSKTIK